MALCCVLATAAGCEPADLSGSVQAQVYRLDPATQEYGFAVAAVDHLDSLREVRGRDLVVRSGTELNTTFGGDQVVRGRPASLEYTLDGAGVVIPGDLHSLYVLSLYRNLDRTAALIRDHGFAPAAPLDILYFPRMDSVLAGDGRSTFTDNAAYANVANGFLIVPSYLLGDLPMFLNEGVMAHEYGHAVIHQILFGPTTDSGSYDAHLYSMHEGVADLFGFFETGDPDYIRPTADVDRDLAVPRSYTDADLAELLASTGGLDDTLDPHVHGSTMARAIYELWPKGADGKISEPERMRLLDATVNALRGIQYVQLPQEVDFASVGPEYFTLATFPNAMVAQLPAAGRPGACAVLRMRLAPLAGRLYNCEGL